MPFTLHDLEDIIAHRAKGDEASSWTAKLVGSGIEKASQKMGEEAIEAVVAAVSGDGEGLRDETADLLYHLLVVLHVRGISVDQVMAELERRTGQSGLEEKASRASRTKPTT